MPGALAQKQPRGEHAGSLGAEAPDQLEDHPTCPEKSGLAKSDELEPGPERRQEIGIRSCEGQQGAPGRRLLLSHCGGNETKREDGYQTGDTDDLRTSAN